jgi:hypothetical protein
MWCSIPSAGPKSVRLEVEVALDDRPHPGKAPTITIDATAWLTSLACSYLTPNAFAAQHVAAAPHHATGPGRCGIWAFAPRPVASPAPQGATAASKGARLKLARVQKSRQVGAVRATNRNINRDVNREIY